MQALIRFITTAVISQTFIFHLNNFPLTLSKQSRSKFFASLVLLIPAKSPARFCGTLPSVQSWQERKKFIRQVLVPCTTRNSSDLLGLLRSPIFQQLGNYLSISVQSLIQMRLHTAAGATLKL